jgi:hypothetical protein
MTTLHVPSRTAWHAEGLRWIAGVLQRAADALEQPGDGGLPLEPTSLDYPVEEFLQDVRFRLHGRF